MLIQALHREVSRSRRILEIAPTRSVTRVLRTNSPGHYIGIDIDPEADGRKVQVIADLTKAPFRTGTFDLSVCFHVFEHVPEDRAAMEEYARLIASNGIGFIQVPWRLNKPTDEDPGADDEERIRRFGQADHVRFYGEDFEARLAAAGIRARRIHPRDIVTSDVEELMGLRPDPVWIAYGRRTWLALVGENAVNRVLKRRLRRKLNEMLSVS